MLVTVIGKIIKIKSRFANLYNLKSRICLSIRMFLDAFSGTVALLVHCQMRIYHLQMRNSFS